MHLFKNKTKDVKQFLQQMKANKTNRSSNQHSLDKSNITVNNSAKHSQEQQYYRSSNASIGNMNNNKHNVERRSNSRQSNQSNQGSMNTTTTVMRFNPIGGNSRFYPSPPQPNNHRQGYEQVHLRMQEPRHIPTQVSQFQHDYIEPVSEAFSYEHDMGINSGHYSANQRRVGSFDDTMRGFHNLAYHNLSQPMRSQNFSNSHDSYGLRKNPSEAFPMSQHSNTTNYSVSQQHQNSGKNYQNFQKPTFKHEPSNFMTQSSNHYPQKLNQFEIQKNHFNNSQQIYNPRFNQQKPFASQVSNFDYEMSEICEAEAGLSTEKGSPGKLTELSSKNKDLHQESKETPMKKITQSNIFEILEDEKNASQQKEKVQQVQNSKPSHRNLCFVEKNIELKHQPLQLHKSSSLQKQLEQKKICVSESQRLKLTRSFHQINSSYMQVDRLLKETSILFSNIERASDEFNKNLRIKDKYAKYLQRNVQNIHQQMEIQPPLHRDEQTLKKRMNRSNKQRDFQNEKTFKKDSRRVKEIEI